MDKRSRHEWTIFISKLDIIRTDFSENSNPVAFLFWVFYWNASSSARPHSDPIICCYMCVNVLGCNILRKCFLFHMWELKNNIQACWDQELNKCEAWSSRILDLQLPWPDLLLIAELPVVGMLSGIQVNQSRSDFDNTKSRLHL